MVRVKFGVGEDEIDLEKQDRQWYQKELLNIHRYFLQTNPVEVSLYEPRDCSRVSCFYCRM